jgi:hypothetical protein
MAHNTKVVKITKHFIQIPAVLQNYTVKPTNILKRQLNSVNINFYSTRLSRSITCRPSYLPECKLSPPPSLILVIK